MNLLEAYLDYLSEEEGDEDKDKPFWRKKGFWKKAALAGAGIAAAGYGLKKYGGKAGVGTGTLVAKGKDKKPQPGKMKSPGKPHVIPQSMKSPGKPHKIRKAQVATALKSTKPPQRTKPVVITKKIPKQPTKVNYKDEFV